LSFIDVGQGDSVLVQAGGETYLIDAGRAEEGPNIVDFLRDRGVRDLDGIIVSNPDADHIGGFLDVFDAFEVDTVFLSGDPKGTLTFNAFLRAAREEGSETEVVRAGTLLDWGGVQADVIAPPTAAEGGLFSETNDNSVGILLTYGTARVLLAGDAEAKSEEYMAGGPYTGPLTVVKERKHIHARPRFPRAARGGRPRTPGAGEGVMHELNYTMIGIVNSTTRRRAFRGNRMDIAEKFEHLLDIYRRPDGRRWGGAELAEATGGVVHRSYVTNLRKGRIESPGHDKLAAIAKAIGFPQALWFDEGLIEGSETELDASLVAALRDETVRETVRELSRLPGRDRRMVLGIVRQFGGETESLGG
jgi:transcriptional regulator with XRE-family HTH domain